LEGDVACGALITKIIERRCAILGLYTPQTATLQVIEAEMPRETSTDKISAGVCLASWQGSAALSTKLDP
jgi:hypothetical protein